MEKTTSTTASNNNAATSGGTRATKDDLKRAENTAKEVMENLHTINKEAMEAEIKMLKAYSNVYEYVGIVRTNFNNFEKVADGKESMRDKIRIPLMEQLKTRGEDAKGQSILTMMAMLTFNKPAVAVKRYVKSIETCNEKEGFDKDFVEWLEENGGIDGVLGYGKSKSTDANNSSAIKEQKVKVVEGWAANANAPMATISGSNLQGTYALLLVERTAANDYIVIDHIDALDNQKADEVKYFKGRKAKLLAEVA
jgi:hypothetical protein